MNRTNWGRAIFYGSLIALGAAPVAAAEPARYAKFSFHLDYQDMGGASSEAQPKTPLLIDGEQLLFGASNGYFYALNRSDGSLKWKYKATFYVSAGPAVGQGMVFFGNSRGQLFAVRRDTGKLVWKVIANDAGTGISPHAELTSNIVFHDGLVSLGTNDGFYRAFDAATGERRWQLTAQWGLSPRSPILLGTALVFNSSEDSGGSFYAVESATGKILWVVKTASFMTSPVAGGGVVYGGGGNQFVALDQATGRVLWQNSYGADSGFRRGQPVLSEDGIFVGLYSGSKSLMKLDRTTGQELWHVALPSVAAVDDEPVLYTGGVLYATGQHRPAPGQIYDTATLYALDPRDGRELWEREFPEAFLLVRPVVADGLMYLGTWTTGEILAVDAATGQ